MNNSKSDQPVPLKRVTFKSKGLQPIINEILDKHQVMEILNISERTLKTLISEGYLPFSPIGNRYYYLYSDLLRMIERNKQRGSRKKPG